MRITNNMMTNTLLLNLKRNMYNMSRLMEQESDGKSIHRPSDDPVGLSKVLKFKTDLGEISQYKKNIRDTLNWYQSTESSIEDLSSAVKRIRDLSVQAANTATHSPEDLKQIMAEIKSLKSHIVSAGNFSYAGSYIFSGYKSGSPLFKTETIGGKEVVKYNVDITERDRAVPQKLQYMVGQSELIQVTTNGLELFGIEEPSVRQGDLSGTFDLAYNYATGGIAPPATPSPANLNVVIDGKVFDVDESKLNEADFLNIQADPVTVPPNPNAKSKEEKQQEYVIGLFKNARAADGQLLGDAADIEFRGDTSTTPPTYKLHIQNKEYITGDIALQDKTTSHWAPDDLEDLNYHYRNPLINMFTDSSGSEFEEGVNSIQARFDLNEDYTGDNMNITVGGVEYDVDEQLLDGTKTPLDKMLILERYKSAEGGGGKLSDVADIYFDEHDNLVIAAKSTEMTPATQSPTVVSLSEKINFSESEMGIASTKSYLKGKIAIDGVDSNYSSSGINVSYQGPTPSGGVAPPIQNFVLDPELKPYLTGYGYTLKKETLLEGLRTMRTPDGSGNYDPNGTQLQELCDVFFDEEDNLIIKSKEYGKSNIEITDNGGAALAGYDYEEIDGGIKTEARVSYADFQFDDDYIFEHEQELKENSIYIVHNGERKEVKLDVDTKFNKGGSSSVVEQYQQALQSAIDKSFGKDKIAVNLTTNSGKSHLSFETINTPDGVTPEIKVEPEVSTRSSLISDVDKLINALDDYDQPSINKFLGDIDKHIDRILSIRSDIGAKTNRMELAMERTKDNELSFTKSLSDVEDVDMAEVIMNLKNFENVYKASLSTGTKIIQPSLVDFIR